LKIYEIVTRQNGSSSLVLPRPAAIRVVRRNRNNSNAGGVENKITAFIAYSSEKLRKQALELLKLFTATEKEKNKNKTDSSSVIKSGSFSNSNQLANEVKWFGSEMIETWEEKWQEFKKREKEIQKAKAKEKEREEKERFEKELSNTQAQTQTSGDSRYKVHPSRQLPPPPRAPSLHLSQALLEALLGELRKSDDYCDSHKQYPLVTYDANLDPRRRKRRKLV